MNGKVFNIGLNRAGTTSLTSALGTLGYRAVHHKHRGVRLYDRIVQNIRRGRRLLAGLEDEYDAFSDFAGQNFFAALDRQYPGSKFILTTRELDAWLDSRERKVEKNLRTPGYAYAFRTVDREKWTRERSQYLARLAEFFRGRERDFLVIDIPAGEGWEKLCPFLGRDIPALPFPYMNRMEPEPRPGVAADENGVTSKRTEAAG